MIWLTWRQHRMQALATLIGLCALAAVFIPTGLPMHHTFAASGLANCLAQGATRDTPACMEAAHAFSQRFSGYEPFGILLLLLPLLLGLFVGAPLVAREIEQGTHRLVWMQGITRRHWALVKVGLLLACTTAVAVVFAWLAYWWMTPLLETTGGRFGYLVFDMQGLVPVAYTMFAVALGVFAGTVWRRALAAMAVTLGGFVALRGTIEVARPHLLPLAERKVPIFPAGPSVQATDDWIINTTIRDASGGYLADGFVICPPTGGSSGACGWPSGAYNLQTFHPAGHFWTFQVIEAGIFTGLAAVLVALAVWQIRRTA